MASEEHREHRHSEPDRVDPTENVLQLVEAAVQRQDDLREAEAKHIREVLTLRADTRRAEDQHAYRISELRANHSLEMRKAEAERLDAIRAIDVNAVQRAAEVQATQAQALATQVSASAEAMRAQVAAVAETVTANQSAALVPITAAIEDLRRAQYEAQGQKSQVVETQAKGGNTATWLGVAVAIAFMLVVGALGIVTVTVTVLLANGKL